MPQLLCQNLAVGYDGKTVVSGLDLEVYAPEIICASWAKTVQEKAPL